MTVAFSLESVSSADLQQPTAWLDATLQQLFAKEGGIEEVATLANQVGAALQAYKGVDGGPVGLFKEAMQSAKASTQQLQPDLEALSSRLDALLSSQEVQQCATQAPKSPRGPVSDDPMAELVNWGTIHSRMKATLVHLKHPEAWASLEAAYHATLADLPPLSALTHVSFSVEPFERALARLKEAEASLPL